MPSDLPAADRPLLFFDTETTGLPDFGKPADDPAQPRIAAICMMLATPEGRTIDVHYQMVRPDGWTMPAEVTAINGLTTEMLETFGASIGFALNWFAEAMTWRPVLVAHNASFDLKMLRGELRRAGLPDRYEDTDSFCTMKAATPLCRLPPTDRMMASGRKGWKSPNLAEALSHFFAGERLPDAHDCLYDTMACRRVFLAIRAALTAVHTDDMEDFR
ncbi:MAG: 3'-5' exonuclease [Caenispirillum sp.]|nr:3'-5' exonuclease [Caenispirillum sp.]